MKIQSMYLNNYRCFKDFEIIFDDRLTVLVGENGAGKTAVLDALSMYLKWVLHIEHGGGSHPNIPHKDVAIGKSLSDVLLRYTAVSINENESDSVDTEFIFSKSNTGGTSIKWPESAAPIERIRDKDNPIFVAYMAGRYSPESAFMFAREQYAEDRHTAIKNSFNRAINYATILTWFKNAEYNETLAMRYEGRKEEFPDLTAVREALSKALLDKYDRPRMHGDPLELVMYLKGTKQKYKVSQLSDGYRAILALVLDLARRMAQSWGNEENSARTTSILHAPAIVLIDEVELHLHPSWQQTVLTTLMKIFPNTQFIVTTHSPQVLTAIPSEHIRILKNGRVYSENEQTQGAEASRLLIGGTRAITSQTCVKAKR